MRIVVLFTLFGFAFANLREKFESWLTEFKIDVKEFGKDIDSCFSTWVQNEKYIIEHNIGNNSYKLGHNKFSCLNSEEFSKFNGLLPIHPKRKGEKQRLLSGQKFPEELDWRNQGVVTDVRDQGRCGSCWAHSAVETIESAYAIKYGSSYLKDFSRQQLVSCDNRKNKENPGSDLGCNGGMMDSAFSWVGANNGLCSEQDYPYTSGSGDTGDCIKTCTEDLKSDVQSYVDVEPNSDEALMSALLVGPVSVAIEADEKSIQLYKSGVISCSTCSDALDHGVVVVGYGHDNDSDLDYWIVRNSWGTSYGMDGYFLLERGVKSTCNKGTGTCGILSCPSYPVL